MTRWIWAALCVTSTLWLCANNGEPVAIAINVVIDAWVIYGAIKGGAS